jgi:hypothetical protein
VTFLCVHDLESPLANGHRALLHSVLVTAALRPDVCPRHQKGHEHEHASQHHRVACLHTMKM